MNTFERTIWIQTIQTYLGRGEFTFADIPRPWTPKRLILGQIYKLNIRSALSKEVANMMYPTMSSQWVASILKNYL